MGKKRIFSIGYNFPGGMGAGVECYTLWSDQSLLDADIIVFESNISPYYNKYGEEYNGKPLVDQSASFQLKENMSRWRSELNTAVSGGKTVFVFLSKLQEAFVYTGEKRFSGTGRSRVTTHMVEPIDNYRFTFWALGRIVSASGKETKLTRESTLLRGYWKEFGEYSNYEVYIDSGSLKAMLTTKTGNKYIGGVHQHGNGNIVLLPPIRYDEEAFTRYDEKEEQEYWTDEAVDFGKKLVWYLLEIDKALRSGREETPPPHWVSEAEYGTKKETAIERKILRNTEKIEKLTNTRIELQQELKKEGILRKLLYEQGHHLEEAILEALRLLEFKVAKYKDDESEFDSLFTSQEGDFLGEAEGKDSEQVKVDKLDHLERNIKECTDKQGLPDFPKGVLFGNAFRFDSPSDRNQEFFSEKCVKTAERYNTALVRTTDLFYVAKYLKENKDSDYAKKCREDILKAEGEVVQFPPVPKKKKPNESKTSKA